jgi:hypothetical protein
VLDGRTGVLFAEQQPDSLAEAIGRFERLELHELHEQEIRENARRFGRERFQQEMAAAIDMAWRQRAETRETGVRAGQSS